MNPRINYAQFDGTAIAVMDYYVKQSETDALCISTHAQRMPNQTLFHFMLRVHFYRETMLIIPYLPVQA